MTSTATSSISIRTRNADRRLNSAAARHRRRLRSDAVELIRRAARRHDNAAAELDAATVGLAESLRRALETGFTQRDLAERLGVPRHSVRRLLESTGTSTVTGLAALSTARPVHEAGPAVAPDGGQVDVVSGGE